MTTEQKVYQLLINHSNTYLSGEEISNQLGLSRTAIWKAINNLKDKGYEILSKPRFGYQLVDNGKLDENFIHKWMKSNFALTLLDTVDSTNTQAKLLAAADKPQVIIANEQTAGYGRYRRDFSSPKNDGIYMSILLSNQPDETLNPGLLTTETAMAIYYAIQECFHISPQIKWVNDILINNKKICGILTEGVADLESGYISRIVVGIGINYTTPLSDFPQDIQDKVGSLRELASKHHVSRNHFIASILNHFSVLYQDYQAGAFMDEYRKASIVIGKEVTIQQASKTITGTVATINNDGNLILTDGQIFTSGEVTKIRY
ncbi:biotin--[acetyl-CoA-carboxylase] ligase [Ligilactobacillus hayakitensis]|uniref:biotin--[acetyl-CoA-carboxylase] ligase n=1 Tax=Ligilactobacillus hayakitensis TaxID=396716 RepID=UPI000468D3E0|nr:biotin--[acetyl-CoA-carboxylase] ligase [Ligilactobacillus hayakitensis]